MTRDDIIRMAQEAGGRQAKSHELYDYLLMSTDALERFFHAAAAAGAAAEREILANWMRQHGFSTGQAYTTDSLLDRLGTEMVENVDAAVLAEREACAKVCLDAGLSCEVRQGADLCFELSEAIRARGEK